MDIQVYEGDGEQHEAVATQVPTDNQGCCQHGWFYLTFNHVTDGPRCTLYAPGKKPQWSRAVASFDTEDAGVVARDAANQAMALHR